MSRQLGPMPFFTSGGRGSAPGERVEQGAVGRKGPQLDTEQKGKKIPGQAVEGEPSTLLAGD